MINLTKIKKVAVVGASNNQEKFGYQVTKNLFSRGFEIFPVNPKEKEILGQKVYSDIELLNNDIDLLIFVLPPTIGIEILRKSYDLGFRKFWFQPGAESKEIKDFLADKNDVEVVFDSCIMM